MITNSNTNIFKEIKKMKTIDVGMLEWFQNWCPERLLGSFSGQHTHTFFGTYSTTFRLFWHLTNSAHQ